ncbi:MAG: GNAT family N-acetyltransferase [Anaerolineales bacterium]
MKSGQPVFKTKELSPRTWPAFERLFAKYNGVQAGCWCMFNHRPGPIQDLGRASWEGRNRKDHEVLVGRRRAHGILVYAGKEAVGWCQYGLAGELPRIDRGRNYRKLKLPATHKLWRITCFFVDREFRHKGVANLALRSALAAIKKRGGGVVEAYPATVPNAVAVWFGTVGMFRRARFRKVAQLGASNVVMRRGL